MRTKLLASVAALTTIGLLAGCGGSGPKSDPDAISMMVPFLETQPPSNDNEIVKRLADITGKKLDITWVPNSSYEDKTNITLAGDDVPQVMVIQGKSAGFVKSAQAGTFWDLTDKLKDYPNLTTTSPAIQKNSSVNGKVYGIYRARDAMRAAVIVRKDWLDKLGLPMPKTTEDLYTVAKAFTEKDPDGNGKNDTTGLTIPKWPGSIGSNSPYDVMETWYGAGNRWTEQDGKLIPSFKTEEFVQANTFMKKMVDEGLVNKDYATLDSAKWNEPFFNGKSGIIIDVHSRAQVLITLFKQQDPKGFAKYVDVTGNLVGPDGTLHAHPTDGYSGFLAIPKVQVRTEDDLKNVLTFLDKLNSKDAAITINNGIEGKNFTVADNLAVAAEQTPENKVLNDAVKSYSQIGTNVAGQQFYNPKQPSTYEQQMFDKRKKIEASDLKSAVLNPAAPFVSKTYVTKGAQLDNIISDARIKFIAGQIDEAGLRKAIKLWETSGGNDIEAEINELHGQG
jgi:putative aldouronate transport system substrate-binding protein